LGLAQFGDTIYLRAAVLDPRYIWLDVDHPCNKSVKKCVDESTSAVESEDELCGLFLDRE